MTSSLKVLTYNIHKGCAGRGRVVLETMRSLVTGTNADIVFLQEIHGTIRKKRGRRKTQFPDQPHFEYLADQAWPHFAYGRNAIYRQGDHGNAILSKFPFVSWENIDVALFPGSSRSILHGILQIPGLEKPLHTLCVHLGLLEHERRKQLRTLAQRIDSHVPHDEPMIVAGDFNDWRKSAERRLTKQLELDELFVTLRGHHARTFPVWFPVLPVDRIYHRGLKPVDCQRLCGGPWRTLSDHAALSGQFMF